MIGQPFNPICEASVPEGISGNITVTWFDPSGNPVATDTSEDTASAILSIPQLGASDFGAYECETIFTSPSLERPLQIPTTLTLDGDEATVSPPDRVATLPPEVTPSTGEYKYFTNSI